MAERGLDISFVDNVINVDYPTHAKVFIHRSGRTARAGKFRIAYTFITKSEIIYLAKI